MHDKMGTNIPMGALPADWSGRTTGIPWGRVRRPPFWRHFILKRSFLPRQARDKYKCWNKDVSAYDCLTQTMTGGAAPSGGGGAAPGAIYHNGAWGLHHEQVEMVENCFGQYLLRSTLVFRMGRPPSFDCRELMLYIYIYSLAQVRA